MPLFEVAMLEVPTEKQAKDGAVETLLVEPTAVVAPDGQSAAIQVAMKVALKADMARVKVLVRPFQ